MKRATRPPSGSLSKGEKPPTKSRSSPSSSTDSSYRKGGRLFRRRHWTTSTSTILSIIGFLLFVILFIYRANVVYKQRQREATTRMNILLLYADDWRHDTLGSAGNPTVKTPVLDNLAKNGIRFTHNCVTTAVCWISRCTLYSGMYMSRHGLTVNDPCENNNFDHCDYNKTCHVHWPEESFPGILQSKAGYYTGMVGKWGQNGTPRNYNNGSKTVDKFNFYREYEGYHMRKISDGVREHITERNEKDALEFLNSRPKDRPFMLTVSFYATHAVDMNRRQYIPQQSSKQWYQNATIPIPVTANDESFHRLPYFVNETNESRNRYHWRFDEPNKHQRMMKNYYRLATEVDKTSGRILKELERQGELDNTLVIFTTDNGNFHAEHGLADKWYPHEESIRVPLIIRDPRMSPSTINTINDEFTLNVDLAPTIIGAAGLTPPSRMQGRDIADLYLRRDKQQSIPWRKEFFYEHPIIYNATFIPSSQALVRKDYKYMYWPDFGVHQLFDLKTDPIEDNDIIDSPQHATVLSEMKSRFAQLKAEVI